MIDTLNTIVVLYGVFVLIGLSLLAVRFFKMKGKVARMLALLVACSAVMVVCTLAFSLVTAFGYYRTLPLEFVLMLRLGIFTAGGVIGWLTPFLMNRL